MPMLKIITRVTDFFNDVLKKPGNITAVIPVPDEGWKVQIEVAEDVEYMRKRARDDLMAMYEVTVDTELQIKGYERISLRERNSNNL